MAEEKRKRILSGIQPPARRLWATTLARCATGPSCSPITIFRAICQKDGSVNPYFLTIPARIILAVRVFIHLY